MDKSPSSSSQTFTFEIGKKTLTLDFPKSFALGDTLLEAGHLQAARAIFEALAKVPNRGPRAKIMLAQCEAALKQFAACAEILDATFNGEDKPIAEDLQSAFVFHRLGLREDAIRAINKLAVKFESLPTLCLVLGDLFSEQGKPDKAKACWKLAVKRDRLRGGVAMAAQRRLKKNPSGKSRA